MSVTDTWRPKRPGPDMQFITQNSIKILFINKSLPRVYLFIYFGVFNGLTTDDWNHWIKHYIYSVHYMRPQLSIKKKVSSVPV